MNQIIRCPNCSADHELTHRGIQMIFCTYCDSSIYWNDSEHPTSGKIGRLPASDTRFFFGAHGIVDNKRFQVIGHVQYKHDAGKWDEWYLSFSNGTYGWLSEDERRLSLETQIPDISNIPDSNQLRIGEALVIKEHTFTVREKGFATCVGGKGQLPFKVEPQEKYAYADLASTDGQHFATLEYDRKNGPSIFLGKPISDDNYKISNKKEGQSQVKATRSKTITCDNCAGTLKRPSKKSVQTVVCTYCGAQLKLTETESVLIGLRKDDRRNDCSLELGAIGNINGVTYSVAGRTISADDEGYLSCEYILYNSDKGYLWLAEENGHFVLLERTLEEPNTHNNGDVFRLGYKSLITVGSTNYLLYESGEMRLIYLDGELPWIAKVGDRARYIDFIAPPKLFSVSQTESEREYYQGQYYPVKQLQKDFNLEKPLFTGSEPHPAQPYSTKTSTKIIVALSFIFFAINAFLWSMQSNSKGHELAKHKIVLTKEKKHGVLPTVTIPETNILKITATAAVSNDWLNMQYLLVSEKTNKVVMEMDSNVSYYHGYDDGHWEEGSTLSQRYYRAPPPGNYKIIWKGDTRNWLGKPIYINISHGGLAESYFGFLSIAFLLIPIWAFFDRISFKSKKWAHTIEDDD